MVQRRGGCSRAFKRNHVVQVGVSVRRQTGHLLRALCPPLAKKAGVWSHPEADRGRVSTIASTATVPRWRPSPPPTKCRVTPEPGDAKNASLRCVEFRGKAVRGRSSVVERQLPKLNVVGSIPIARSKFSRNPNWLRRMQLASASSNLQICSLLLVFPHSTARAAQWLRDANRNVETLKTCANAGSVLISCNDCPTRSDTNALVPSIGNSAGCAVQPA